MVWEIFYYSKVGKISMEVEANNFDEAIAKARVIDSNFNSGRVKE